MNRVQKILGIVAICVCGMLAGCNGASDTAVTMIGSGPTGFMIKTMTRGNRTRQYALFVPAGYEPALSRSYPVLIFLHGVGEGGNDPRACLRVGLGPIVAAQSGEFPFFVIFPQSESGSWDENSPAVLDVITELDDVAKTYRVDLDRVSLTGVSTGGYGCYAVAAAFHDRIASIAPMATSSDPGKFASGLTHLPVRAYHNAGDVFAASWNDSGTVDKIKALGGNAAYMEFDAQGHDCWEQAYGDGELFVWFQQQRRRITPEMQAQRDAAQRQKQQLALAQKEADERSKHDAMVQEQLNQFKVERVQAANQKVLPLLRFDPDVLHSNP